MESKRRCTAKPGKPRRTGASAGYSRASSFRLQNEDAIEPSRVMKPIRPPRGAVLNQFWNWQSRSNATISLRSLQAI
jgi:hypothetical protein